MKRPNRVADVEARERADAALQLRLQGLTFREIGERIGLSTSQACEVVTRELDRRRKEPTETTERLRQQEAERMIDIVRRSHGYLLACEDDADRARYLQQIMRASERLAKLHGLDAPVRTESETTVTVAGDQSAVAAVLGATNDTPHEE